MARGHVLGDVWAESTAALSEMGQALLATKAQSQPAPHSQGKWELAAKAGSAPSVSTHVWLSPAIRASSLLKLGH